MLVVKKYANRRLYDTSASRYITLEDLAALIRSGTDVMVQDAHSGADLTQSTLTQIILEMRGGARLLPVPLLMRLIRMGDEALAEFFGRYVSWALELYIQAKQGARTLLPLNPLATAPFAATDALARLVLGASPFNRGGNAGVPPMPSPEPSPAPVESAPLPPDVADTGPMDLGQPSTTADDVSNEMARIRAELDALRKSLGAAARPKAAAKKSASKKKK